MENSGGEVKKILAVDDDPLIMNLLQRTLELEGFAVITTTDSSLALDLLEEHQPDLVILDIMMPRLNGFQVLKLIRERSDVPAIMLTARDDVSSVRDALVLGADDYVRKPFRKEELLARIRAKLRRASQESQ